MSRRQRKKTIKKNNDNSNPRGTFPGGLLCKDYFTLSIIAHSSSSLSFSVVMRAKL